MTVPKPTFWTPERAAVAEAMHIEGWHQKSIADHLGTSPSHVTAILKQRGYRPRTEQTPGKNTTSWSNRLAETLLNQVPPVLKEEPTRGNAEMFVSAIVRNAEDACGVISATGKERREYTVWHARNWLAGRDMAFFANAVGLEPEWVAGRIRVFARAIAVHGRKAERVDAAAFLEQTA